VRFWRSKSSKFPVKFPVSREFGQRKVSARLRPPPASLNSREIPPLFTPKSAKHAHFSRSLLLQSQNSLISRYGVATLFGYGIQVRVDRGHLLLQDGIAADRREIRLPRVGHGLKRLVVIGSDGMVSLSALRWLADQKAAFTLLERDGKVLVTTGPVRPSDARLRRAQALSSESGVAVAIARELIDKKLAGQERVARYKLLATQTADTISRYRKDLVNADTPEAIRQFESLAAGAYWAAWRTLPINFPRKDEPRVPAHWRVFGTRVSPLTGSPRLAVNPPNAMLNFVYAILESESISGVLVAEKARIRPGKNPLLAPLHSPPAPVPSLPQEPAGVSGVRRRLFFFLSRFR
jgi:CRISPR/Cas system-associated endonuclease Cas1